MNTTIKLPVEIKTSSCSELGSDDKYHAYWSASIYFDDSLIASTPYAGYYKTEAAAIRAAKAELKNNYFG